MKVQLQLDVSPQQLDALICLAHTVSMWEKYRSDTEVLDALAEHGSLLQPLIDLRDAELRQRTSFLANGGVPT